MDMEWTSDAEELVSKVPFFVRKRVRKKVEEAARDQGLRTVTQSVVTALQRKFMASMEDEVKGFSIETCFGPSGCPNRAVTEDGVASALSDVFSKKDLKMFLKKKVAGPLKLHHEFRVAVADCPNCCSRPQICDIGFVGAARPVLTNETCSRCGACVTACPDGIVVLREDAEIPEIDFSQCLSCGKCIEACPTETIAEDVSGYRILVGGKLGRHPHLADELPGIYSLKEVLPIVNRCIGFYETHCRQGERFGEVIQVQGMEALKNAVI